MRFSISTAFQPVDHLPALARAADELGYHSMAVPDHVVDLEELATPYPYTPTAPAAGTSRAAWPDPWVLIGVARRGDHAAAVLHLGLRARDPQPVPGRQERRYGAVLSGDRVSLGVGIGWCREEFELLGQDFSTRGKRTDEALALMAELWKPGWTEFEGEFYTAPAARHGADPDRADPDPRRRALRGRVPPRRPPRRLGRRPLHDRRGHRASPHSWPRRAARSAPRATSRSSPRSTTPSCPSTSSGPRPAGSPTAGRCRGRTTTGSTATLEQKVDGMERFAADVLVPLNG